VAVETQYIKHSESFFRLTLFIQHAKRMHCIMLSSVAYLALPHFTTLSQKGTILGKRGTEYKTCV